LADGLHMPVPNAYAAMCCDNSREGGEGIPDQFDQSRMKVGAQSFRDVSKERTLNKTKRKVITMLNVIRQFVKNEQGATAAEYALLLALITVVLVGAVTGLSGAIGGAMTTAAGIIGS
jgi:pilus assembly protein Flp/PilA